MEGAVSHFLLTMKVRDTTTELLNIVPQLIITQFCCQRIHKGKVYGLCENYLCVFL